MSVDTDTCVRHGYAHLKKVSETHSLLLLQLTHNPIKVLT